MQSFVVWRKKDLCVRQIRRNEGGDSNWYDTVVELVDSFKVWLVLWRRSNLFLGDPN